MAIKDTVTGVTNDNLFGGPEVPGLTKNITIASGAALTRGSLLTLAATSGKYSLTAAGKVASAVLSADTDASKADAVATVYVSGRFNREALVVDTGDTATAHEEELRDAGIFLTSEK